MRWTSFPPFRTYSLEQSATTFDSWSFKFSHFQTTSKIWTLSSCIPSVIRDCSALSILHYVKDLRCINNRIIIIIIGRPFIVPKQWLVTSSCYATAWNLYYILNLMRQLRSASLNLLSQLPINIALAYLSFRYAGPAVWNSLLHLLLVTFYTVFKSNLKTNFFCDASNSGP